MATLIRSWRLFAMLAVAVSAANCFGLQFADLRTAHGTEFMVFYAVLCALPLLLVAFTASSLVMLWPSRATRRILANRKFIGLAFAFAMSWHFAFVAYFMASYGYRLRWFDLTLDIIGACFLLGMTLTSFRSFSRHVSGANWHRLHKTGIYTLWLVPTYDFLDDYVEGRKLRYLVLFGVLLAAMSLRVLARRRASAIARTHPVRATGC